MAEFKLGRIRFVWKNQWSGSTEYFKDDVVAFGGRIYICTIGHTSQADFYTDFDVSPAKWNLVSDGQNWKGDWSIDTDYVLNDIVKYGGRLYICNTVHTSASTTDLGLEQDQSKWDIYAEGLDWKGEWTLDTRYKVDDLVKYGGITYVCNTSHTSAATESDGLEIDQAKWDIFNKGIEYKGQWEESVRYKLNDVARYGGTSYIITTPHTSTNDFKADTANWEQFIQGFQYENEWSPYIEYQKGDVVQYGGNQYVAKENHLNGVPSTDTVNWDLFTNGLRFLGDWGDDSSNQDYRVGDVVRLGGYTYRCVQDHQNQQPPNTTYWSLLNSGFNWRGNWTDDQEYFLGDVIRYGSNSYVCILGHISEGDDFSTVTQTDPGGGNANSRPDLDIAGTYWSIIAIGTESAVLTTTGDMVYYSGSAPVRLPIGDNGQILQVGTEGIPEWKYFAATDDVYYVAQTGVDEPAPTYGKSLDRPFKTIRYAAEQILKGARNPNASKLIELNRMFIQREVTEWIGYQIDNAAVGSIWENFEYDTVKCERDVGFILDRTRHDLTHGGNLKTRAAAQTFVNALSEGPFSTAAENNGTGTYNNLSAEGDQSVAAYNYALSLVDKVLKNQAPDVNYQVTNGDNSTAIIEQYIDVTVEAEDGSYDTIADLFKIITDTFTTQNSSVIPARVVPQTLISVATGAYEETLPIVVPAYCAVQGDELRSVTVKPSLGTVDISDSYYTVSTFEHVKSVVKDIVTGTTVTPTSGNTTTQSQDWPLAETTQANKVESLVDVMKHQADWRLGTLHTRKLTTGEDYSGTFLVGYDTARVLLEENREFIKAEAVGYMLDQHSDLKFGKTLTKRDAGYVVDALYYDLTYGGNAMSVKAGLAYYDGDDATDPQFATSLKTPIINTLNYLKTVMVDIAANTAVTSPKQTDVVQFLATGSGASIAAQNAITNNVEDIVEIINTGPAAVGTTVTLTDPTPVNGENTTTALINASNALDTATAGIQTDTINWINTNYPDLTYDSTKCSRDIGIILKAVRYDFMFDANFQTLKAAHAYLRPTASEVYTLNQKAVTREAIQYALLDATDGAIANVGSDADAIARINVFAEIIDNVIFGASNEGSVCQTEVGNAYAAVLQLERNRDFITQETKAHIATTYTDTVVSTANSTGYVTIADTSWLRRGAAIRFSGDNVQDGGLVDNVTYYVREIIDSSIFTISSTRYGAATTLQSTTNTFTVSLYYNEALCLRDVGTYIDALKDDLVYPGNYKSRYVSRYYANAVVGSQEEDMFYMRDATGLRGFTTDGLNGDLLPENSFGTSRVSAGAYASLDPGWGPDDFTTWIITRSPFMQSVTCIGNGAIGQKIDGALHNGGNDSMVSNDFTQLVSDGIGAWITNNGRAELVSVFTYYSYIGYLAEAGGRVRATNGNNSYGTFGSVAEGVDADETPTTAIVDNKTQYTATIANVATDASEILVFEYNHAGDEYTEAKVDVFGPGRNESLVMDEFRDGGYKQGRVVPLNDSAGVAGGKGYTVTSNTAQAGGASYIDIAATDGSLSTAYPGMRVQIVGGAANGQYGIIDTYNAGSKRATVLAEGVRTQAGSFDITKKYRIDYLGNTNWQGAGATDGVIGEIFTPTGVGFGTGYATEMVDGWDHIVPGYPITSPNASSTYVIEPRLALEGPLNVANNRTLASNSYSDAVFMTTSATYNGVSATGGDGSSATFNVIRNGSKYYVELVSGGTDYTRLNTLTIAGTDLGGASTANDITITVTTVNSATGAIVDFDFSGEGRTGRFIALPGSGQTAAISLDGVTWTTDTLPTPGVGTWHRVASGLIDDGSSTFQQSAIVAVATGSNNVIYSEDGDTWSSTTLPVGFDTANGQFVAYGNVDTNDNRFVVISNTDQDVAYSLNGGATWAVSSNALPSTGYTCITYGMGMFLALKANSTEGAYSTDGGATWTTITISNQNWVDVTWGNGRFLAISGDSNDAMYSFNGVDWTDVTMPALTGNPTKVAYGQGIFVVSNSDVDEVNYSENGVLWNTQTLASSITNGTNAIAFGNPSKSGKFIAIGNSTTTSAADLVIGSHAKARTAVTNEQIFEARIIEPGSTYSSAPGYSVFDPNNVIDMVFENKIGNGVLAQPTWINRGQDFVTANAELDNNNSNGFAEFDQDGSFIAVRRLSQRPIAGSNIQFDSLPGRFFKLVNTISFLGTNEGSYTAFLQVNPALEIDEAPPEGDPVSLRIRFSQVRLTGHDFLDIGTGNKTDTNYPGVPVNDPVQANETREANGGRVFYTSTDQDGNFRVGDLFEIEQATGVATLDAEAFNIAGLQELTLGEVTLGGNSASISEFSTDPFFTANSDSIVPTQRAVKAYIESQIGGGGASLNVNSVTAGDIFIGTDQITTVSGSAINIKANVVFTGTVLGTPLAFNYFIR